MGQSVVFTNTLQKSRTIKVTLTASDQAAAQSAVYLFAAKGKAADKTAPTGITISGDYTSFADWYDMVGNVKFGVEEIKVETSNTSNYEGTKLTIGKRNLNNRNNQEQDLFLSDFQVSQGNGLKKTATIDVDALGGGFMVDNQFYAKFDGVQKETSVTFYIKVSHEEAMGNLAPASF